MVQFVISHKGKGGGESLVDYLNNYYLLAYLSSEKSKLLNHLVLYFKIKNYCTIVALLLLLMMTEQKFQGKELTSGCAIHYAFAKRSTMAARTRIGQVRQLQVN